jgi:SAM-dependent methyltransferase
MIVGYGASGLILLGQLVEVMPPRGALLELGQQNIEPGVPSDAVLACARKIQGDEDAARRVAGQYDGINRCPISELFRESQYRYRCLDLYPGEFTIVADLNLYSVPAELRCSFDLIMNIGTTEHITDQVNVFRVIHDLAKPGASFLHSVPFAGYFNHGLYNYQPIFFVFLAAANEYEIVHLELSDPAMPYTIPEFDSLAGAQHWTGQVIYSGDIGCHLRKVHDRPFQLFTDFDRAVMGQRPSPWNEMVRKRHDLRVRNAGLNPASAAANRRSLGWVSGLVPGDLIRQPQHSGRVAVVTENHGDHVTAVMTFDVANPSEWELVSKAQHGKPI